LRANPTWRPNRPGCGANRLKARLFFAKRSRFDARLRASTAPPTAPVR
jgi:hypothetical protein